MSYIGQIFSLSVWMEFRTKSQKIQDGFQLLRRIACMHWNVIQTEQRFFYYYRSLDTQQRGLQVYGGVFEVKNCCWSVNSLRSDEALAILSFRCKRYLPIAIEPVKLGKERRAFGGFKFFSICGLRNGCIVISLWIGCRFTVELHNFRQGFINKCSTDAYRVAAARYTPPWCWTSLTKEM